MIERFTTLPSATQKVERAALMASVFLDSVTAESIGLPEDHKFDMANVNLGELLLVKEEMLHVVNPVIKTFKSFNPWSASNGYTNTGDFSTIYLNTRKLNRTIPEIASTIIHEFFHCLEYGSKIYRPGIFFNHGDNNPKGKENTVQYLMDSVAEKWIEEYTNRWINTQQFDRNERVAEAEAALQSRGWS